MPEQINYKDKIGKFILCRDLEQKDLFYELLVSDVLSSQLEVISLRPRDKIQVLCLRVESIEYLDELDETTYLEIPFIAEALQAIRLKRQEEVKNVEAIVDTSKLLPVDRKTLVAATRVDEKHKNEKFRDCFYATDIEVVKKQYGFRSGSEIVYFVLGRLAWWCKKEKRSIKDIVTISPLRRYNAKWLKKPKLLDTAIDKVCSKTKSTAKFRLNGIGKMKQDRVERLKTYIKTRKEVTYKQIQNAFRDFSTRDLKRTLNGWAWKRQFIGHKHYGEGTKWGEMYYWLDK